MGAVIFADSHVGSAPPIKDSGSALKLGNISHVKNGGTVKNFTTGNIHLFAFLRIVHMELLPWI
jgi:hypothetical protein